MSLTILALRKQFVTSCMRNRKPMQLDLIMHIFDFLSNLSNHDTLRRNFEPFFLGTTIQRKNKMYLFSVQSCACNSNSILNSFEFNNS